MRLALAILAVLAAACALAAWHEAAPPRATASEARTAAVLPAAYERNDGQAPARFDFLARSRGATLGVHARGAELATGGAPVRLAFEGAARRAPRPVDRLPGTVNHLVGDDPSRHHVRIPTFERVRYPAAWPGVDIEWHVGESGPEYDLVVAPRADPRRIAMRFPDGVRATPGGGLASGALRQRRPRAFQRRTQIPVGYAIEGNVVHLRLGAYDRTRELVIDPVVLAYSTYLGGGRQDIGFQVAVDPIGQAYVTGLTTSTDFDRAGGIEGDEGGTDAFVAKLNPAGDRLAYATYLGGSAEDYGTGIAVDDNGFAYVTGTTRSTDFNTTPGALQTDQPDADAFVAKLDPAGDRLAYSTYLGGNDEDFSGFAIDVDSTGAAYVSGLTGSTDFPLAGAFQGNQAGIDAYVTKLGPTGGALGYSTYLGGTRDDSANGIAVDPIGEAYVIGTTSSENFPTAGGVQGDAEGEDVFVAKLAPAGDRLGYSTYLGGSGAETGHTVAVDTAGFAYVTGFTFSADFPVENAFQSSNGGASDAFVARLAPAGDALAYSTYLGGGSGDRGNTIGIDSTGAAYIVGQTSSPDFPLALEHEACDRNDPAAFVTKLAPGGDRLSHSTCLGGGLDEAGNGLAVHPTGFVVVTGATDSFDFDVVGPIEGDSPGTDVFVTKLAFTSTAPSPTATTTPSGTASPAVTAPPSATAPPAGTATPSATAPPAEPLPPPRPVLSLRRPLGADALGRFRFAFRAQAGVTGRATFRRAGTRVARRGFTVPSSGKVSLRVQLRRPARRRLAARGRLRLRVTVTVRDATGLASSARGRVTVKPR